MVKINTKSFPEQNRRAVRPNFCCLSHNVGKGRPGRRYNWRRLGFLWCLFSSLDNCTRSNTLQILAPTGEQTSAEQCIQTKHNLFTSNWFLCNSCIFHLPQWLPASVQTLPIFPTACPSPSSVPSPAFSFRVSRKPHPQNHQNNRKDVPPTSTKRSNQLKNIDLVQAILTRRARHTKNRGGGEG